MATIEFQRISPDERKAIMIKIDDIFGEGVAPRSVGEMDMITATGKRVEVFLVPEKVLTIFRKTQGKRNPYCLGIYLGDLVDDTLLPSIEGATLCAPYTARKICVTDKGEQAVLYGRDIKCTLVEDFPSSIRKGDRIVVVNKLNETMALAKALIDGNKFNNTPKDTVVAKNVLDRGWYIREGT